MLKQIKPVLKPNTILVDATVPLAASIGGRVTRTIGIWQGSAAQQAAEILKGTPVVAAFQNISAEFLNGEADLDSDVIVCGDDEKANQIIRGLAKKFPASAPSTAVTWKTLGSSSRSRPAHHAEYPLPGTHKDSVTGLK